MSSNHSEGAEREFTMISGIATEFRSSFLIDSDVAARR